MGKIHELPKSTSCLITSSQIITSVFCVVKELLENSLDGAAKNVEVKLEDYGLEKIEVKDNGCGIDKSDIPFVARPHFTSKLSSFSDLENVNTYGFRGEALGAICAVADLIITTKASEEAIGYTVNYDHDGQVLSIKPCPCPQGSTVSILNLFKNIPVRKQYYRSEKNKKDDLKKVEELLVAYGCIVYDVRFALYHNKNLIWQKPALSCTKNALIHVLGNSVVDHLKYSEYVDEQNQRKFEIFLPSSTAPSTCGLSLSSRCITAINNRPVRIRAFDKLIKEYYNKAIQNTGKARYPICFISFSIPLKETDVNIDANKTNVMLHHSEEILSQFSELLKKFYNINVTENNNGTTLPPESAESNPEPKQSPSDFLESIKAKSDAKFQQLKLSYLSESPINTKNNLFANDVIVNNNLSQKRENPVVKKDVTKEPSKKKLKTSFHASENDFQSHLTSLKNFFSQDKTVNNNMPLSTMPKVTVERINPVPKCLSSDAEMNDNISSNRITTFAVTSNISANSSSPLTVEPVINQEKPFSDSSFTNENLVEKNIKQPVIDNGEAWSRGVHPAGGLFQPVKVLQPKAAVLVESSSKVPSPMFTESKKEIPEQKNLSFERKLTAFDIFCRDNRLEIAAQNPEYNNQQIAQILSEKWNHLSSEEKAVYKNMLDKDYKQNVKKKERLSKMVSESLSQTQNKASSGNPKKKMKPKLSDKVMDFHIEDAKEYYKNSNREMPPSNGINIINYLAPGVWICSEKGKLVLLNTFRLHETIIYHRLLETFQFESVPLEKPLCITASDVGIEGMEILMKLSKAEINTSLNIDDQRITANGFDIKVSKNMQNNVLVELIGLTNNVAFYGIPDLKELLLLIKSEGDSVNLSECRPGKIMLYLQSEANRMSRHSPACQRIQDVEDLLHQNNILKRYKECIHHKPFFNELWSFQ